MKGVIRSHNDAYRFVDKVCNDLGQTFERPQLITIEPVKKIRTLAQNAYLFGVCYPTILECGSEELRGWTKDDLHDFFLIDHFGSEVIEGFGKRRHTPLKRSAKLSKIEFSDYIAHIQLFCAERGIVIPDPEEQE